MITWCRQQLTGGGFRDPSPTPPPNPPPPPPYEVVPPLPLPAVPPAQDDTPQFLMTPAMTNIMQYDNVGLMTTPPSPPLPSRFLPDFAQSPCFSGGDDSPGIPAPEQDVPPLSTRDGSPFQMGHSESGCSNPGWEVLIGTPNATRPSPSLLMRRSDSGYNNSDRSVQLLRPMSTRRSPSPNVEDD
jgi:hypothetical protein